MTNNKNEKNITIFIRTQDSFKGEGERSVGEYWQRDI
jgi:hypothetical protein